MSACAAAATAAGAANTSILVRADGRIGPFRIDTTSEAEIRRVAGRPAKVENVYDPSRKAPVGHMLEYRCGRGCWTAYSIRNATGRLSDFSSESPRFVTERGSHVGMTARSAATREGRTLLPGCGDALYLHLRWDRRRQYALIVRHERVDSIAYLGPHSIFYEGFC